MKVEWIDSGREPSCAPNPEYPDGIHINMPSGMVCCRTDLPYPAKRCGIYMVSCDRCGSSVAVTTAGRRDDPRSVEVPCKNQQTTPRKPTIEELVAILNSEEDVAIEILPNGEVRAKGSGESDKQITMRENLGGEYAA